MLAYHEDSPTLYLIPNLDMCMLTKDIHWVCPSNPFIRDTTEHLCGLRVGASSEKCRASMTFKDDVEDTRIERIGPQWLVNTPMQEIAMSYDRPQGTTVHIEDTVLHYLNPERYDTEI